MALTFKIAGVPSGIQPADSLTIAPAVRPPVDVRFRPGADLRKVAARVLAEPHVRLMAAVGAGKSSRMPHALAAEAGTLVVYTTASPLLALSAYGYAAKRAVDDNTMPELYKYSVGIEADMPRSGVMYCGAGDYVSMMLRSAEAGRVLPPHVVFLDEAHKCDTWTYVVGRLSLAYGATTLVKVSATFEPDAEIMRETAGSVEESKYPAVAVEQWDVSARAMPWSVTSIRNNVVVYTDSRSEAAHLLDEYRIHGYIVHRLEASMAEEQFHAAMTDLNDKRGPLVALIADSSFRDGFSFDCSRCVDTGRVGYYKYRPGTVVRSYRELYLSERRQTAGRFGRLDSGKAEYYYPDVAYPLAMCELAPVEMEAAAYVYRLLGYQPTGELASAVMATADLPALCDFAVVVNALYPLQHYVLDAEGRPRTPPLVGGRPRKRDSGVTSSDETSTDSASLYGSVGSFSRPLSPDGCTESVGAVPSASDGFGSLFAELRGQVPGPVTLREGQYCHVSSLPVRAVSLTTFPRGLESVDKYLSPDLTADELARAVARFDPGVRDDALELVSARYNALNAHLRAITAALGRVRDSGVSVSAGPGFWRKMELLAEQHTEMHAERSVMMGRLKALTDGCHSVSVLDATVAAESERADELESELMTAAGLGRRDQAESVERLEFDMKTGGRSGSRSRSVSMGSLALDTGDPWTMKRYKTSVWTGCRSVHEWSDALGRVARTTYRTNAMGRLLSGGVSKVTVQGDVVKVRKSDGTVCVQQK